MIKEDFKNLEKDTNGLSTYEFLINNLFSLSEDDLDMIIARLSKIDTTGQYLASSARYLNAIDKQRFKVTVSNLLSFIINKDREHRYLKDIMVAIYGDDYIEKATEYEKDDNFRRLFKRLHPSGAI